MAASRILGIPFAHEDGPRPSPLPPVTVQDTFDGTAANDHFTGTAGADVFNMGDGGDDTVSGKAADDIFNFGAALTAADSIDGGNGNDTVTLSGNYTGASALVFAATTLKDAETLQLSAGSFDLTTNDSSVGSGQAMTVDASALGTGQTLTFDGSAETDGDFTFEIGAGQVTLSSGSGSDTFVGGANFKASDRIDGGSQIGFGGGDVLTLDGDYATHPLIFESATIRNIEEIGVGAGHNYSLSLDHGNAFIAVLEVNGSALGAADRLFLDGSDIGTNELELIGGAGNDTLIGGAGPDEFLPGAGSNIVKGGSGDDVVRYFNAGEFNNFQAIDGGDGQDTLDLTGGDSANFNDLTIRSVENLVLRPGSGVTAYAFALSAGNVVAGATLTVDTTTLHSGDAAQIDARQITDGRIVFNGGLGNDTFTLGRSGQDVFRSGGGQDLVIAGANFQETDRITGSTINDMVLNLTGDYSDRLQFQGRTIRDVPAIQLGNGFSYNLATADGNVAAGKTMFVTGSSLTGLNKLIFDGSKETNGGFFVQGGAGNDVLTGGAGNDTFQTGAGTNTVDASRGGTDHITGGAGNDTYIFGAAFDNTDTVTTGGGNDTMLLDGDYSTTTFNLPGVRTVKLAVGNSYHLGSAIAGGLSQTVDGTHLGSGDTLTFNGAGAAGTLFVIGGGAPDTLTGGAGIDTITGHDGDDTITGGGGKDSLNGGAGKDIFVYSAASQSSSINYDAIGGFSTIDDRLNVSGSITKIEATVNGALSASSQATFDADIGAAVNATLKAHEAILFIPNGGDGALIGHRFLIVDQNGSNGYQSGGDLVIDITGVSGTMATSLFI